MTFRQNRRLLVLIIFSIFSVIAFSFLYQLEHRYSMGVKIIPESQTEKYTLFSYTDYSEHILLDGVPVAIDKNSRTIYLSHDVEYGYKDAFYALPCELTIDIPDCEMFFIRDSKQNYLSEAVETAHPFRLIIAEKGSSVYMEYNVVITTLPVINLEGNYSYTDREERRLYYGNVFEFTPVNVDTGRYTIGNYITYWRTRGDRDFIKKSYKLSLKDEANINFDASLLKLGKDDDWLLNSMKMDDTNIKERLVMQLWNDLCLTAPYNRKMSYGEFCELVINGEYKGLYMLQRRVDEKYLELGDNSILAKGGDVYIDVPIDQDVEIVHSPFEDDDYTYSLLNEFYSLEDCSQINIDNFIDTNIFLQFGMLGDNVSYKNIFYIMDPLENNNYEMSLLLWDTDASFPSNDIESISDIYLRRETEAIKNIYPDLDSRTARRWFELRQTLLSNSNISAVIEDIHSEFRYSGAVARDYAVWGHYYENDTVDALYSTIENRLAFLDEYYSRFI